MPPRSTGQAPSETTGLIASPMPKIARCKQVGEIWASTCIGSESVLLSLRQYSWHSAGLLSHLRRRTLMRCEETNLPTMVARKMYDRHELITAGT